MKRDRKIDFSFSRLNLVKASIFIAFIAGFLLSPHLWLNEGRLFPIIKLSESIPTLPAPFDIITLLLFIGLSITWIFNEKKWIGYLAIGTLLLILIQDQMRWQPWVYLYLLMLLPFLHHSQSGENKKAILICLQMVIAGLYIWSGVHKVNPNFLEATFGQLTKTFGIELSQGWKKLGYALPLIEIGIGLFLLIPRFRRVGIYGAVAMHVIVLLFLSPVVWHHNSVVYPWNIAMILFVFLLFWNNTDNLFYSVREIRSHLLMIVAVTLVWIFPILNLFGYWDHYLSFSLYSDKAPLFYIAIEKNELHKIDRRFNNYFARLPGMEGGQLIDVHKWAFAELNVPFYPEERLFRKLSSQFCELGINDDKLIFLELYTANGKTDYRKFTCGELKSGSH